MRYMCCCTSCYRVQIFTGWRADYGAKAAIARLKEYRI